MELYGATCIPSPSNLTAAAPEPQKRPDTPGSLGMAISEAVEDAVSRDDTNYSLGSVLNHVCLHQSIIGQEVKLQMDMVDDYPDVVIGCCGGGSNFAGIAFPFIPDKLAVKDPPAGSRPAACPTLTKGIFAYDYGGVVGLTPAMKMYTLGHDFVPSGIHAGGLRYHGASPLLSQLYHDGLIEAIAVKQNAAFEAAMLFARTESIVPAPESAHAIRAAIDEALKAKEEGVTRTIVFNLSGHGNLDLYSYDKFLAGETEDVEFSDEELAVSIKDLPEVK